MNAILVVGATGNVGRPLVVTLVDAGAEEVLAVIRHPDAAALPDAVPANRSLFTNSPGRQHV